MLITVVLTLLLLGAAKSYWDEGTPQDELMLYIRNVTCNDDVTSCVHCYIREALGNKYIDVFKYLKSPYQIQFSGISAIHQYMYTFVNGDDYQPFRLCLDDDLQFDTGLDDRLPFHICVSNDFSGGPLPMGCQTPVVIVSMAFTVGDDRVRGHQILYCQTLRAEA